MFVFLKRAACIACAGLLLAGCAETELASHWMKGLGGRPPPTVPVTPKSKGSYKIGNPYRIEGKWYTPVESYSYDETGISSWYGDQFHGKRTANGEVFDKNALTAAHPTLQMPSLIRVTNLENGRSAVLRVNDRGPFARSRLIDVSHHAADVLGYAAKGTARVRVQVLERESRILAEAAKQGHPPQVQMAMAFRPPTGVVESVTTTQVASADPAAPVISETTQVTQAEVIPPVGNVTTAEIEDLNKQLFRKFPVQPTSMYVQVGSFSDAANAAALAQQLNTLGPANVYPSVVNGQQFNRVRIGPIATVPEADALLARAIAAGHAQSRIVVD